MGINFENKKSTKIWLFRGITVFPYCIFRISSFCHNNLFYLRCTVVHPSSSVVVLGCRCRVERDSDSSLPSSMPSSEKRIEFPIFPKFELKVNFYGVFLLVRKSFNFMIKYVKLRKCFYQIRLVAACQSSKRQMYHINHVKSGTKTFACAQSRSD